MIGAPFLIPDIREKAFNNSPIEMMFNSGVVIETVLD